MNIYNLHSNPEELYGYNKRNNLPEYALSSLDHEEFQEGTPEYEHAVSVILKDPMSSYYYASNIIFERFPEGEEIISQDGTASFLYAKDVIKGRFRAGEKAIEEKPLTKMYKNNVIDVYGMDSGI